MKLKVTGPTLLDAEKAEKLEKGEANDAIEIPKAVGEGLIFVCFGGMGVVGIKG